MAILNVFYLTLGKVGISSASKYNALKPVAELLCSLPLLWAFFIIIIKGEKPKDTHSRG